MRVSANHTAMFIWLLVGGFILHVTYSEKVTVRTTHGEVVGSIRDEEEHRIEEYLGIPFAKPPVDKLRFQPPVEPDPWSQPYNADSFSAPCIQRKQISIGMRDPETALGEKSPSEDCLYLNVWTPGSNDGKLKPVLVWIHGGAWVLGATSQGVYHGSILAALNDVVVVSVNYRLGIFGFLYSGSSSAPGNMGLLDQRQALIWVKENIRAFGGDPHLITIFGESAGSMSVSFHVLSPLSKGLFKRAIMMSGTTYCPLIAEPPQKSLLRGNNVARVVGCASAEEDIRSNPDNVIQCLREKSADELLVTSVEVAHPSVVTFAPVFSDAFCPKAPILSIDRGEFNNVDVLAGTTSQEAALFYSFRHPEFLGLNLNNFTLEDLHKTGVGVMEEWGLPPIKAIIEYYTKGIDDKLKLCTELMNYFSDYLFTCPTKYFSERYSDKKNNVFMYRFNQLPEKIPIPETVGVPHFFEIPFVFGRPFAVKERYTERDREFSRQVMKIFVSFAITGVPELPSGEEWPKYSRNNPVHVNLKFGKVSFENDLRKEKCDYLRKFI